MAATKKISGLGEYQMGKIAESQVAILITLIDGEWHQYGDLKEKSRLSSATLTKHLKRLDFIEKRTDNESGKYPFPVLYRVKPSVVPIHEVKSVMECEKQEIEAIISAPNKNPLDVLDQINRRNNHFLLLFLKMYKEHKDTSPQFMNILLELLVWNPYKNLTSHLLDSSRKIIEKIEINELLESNSTTIYVGKNGLKKALRLDDSQINELVDKYHAVSTQAEANEFREKLGFGKPKGD